MTNVHPSQSVSQSERSTTVHHFAVYAPKSYDGLKGIKQSYIPKVMLDYRIHEWNEDLSTLNVDSLLNLAAATIIIAEEYNAFCRSHW